MFQTISTYKFWLAAHPALIKKLTDKTNLMVLEGQTDGQIEIKDIRTEFKPITDPAEFKDLVVIREWATLEHAQEWATAWSSTVAEYVATEEGANILPGSWSVEVISL
jgi:hypothetical protein